MKAEQQLKHRPFLVAFIAFDRAGNYAMAPALLSCVSTVEATQRGLAFAREKYPVSQGWGGHNAFAEELPLDVLRGNLEDDEGDNEHTEWPEFIGDPKP